MVKVGIFGAGFAGSHHALAYRNCPDANLVAIVDIDPERASQLAAKFGCDWGPDPGKILADPAIDIVDICLPTPSHKDHAISAFSAGKHVIIEKPLALTLAEADAILASADTARKFLMVGHVLRFWPEYVAVRQKLLSGEVGKPIAASAIRLSNKPQWAEWFRDPRKTGGAVLDLMIHDLDMLNWLFGRPLEVSAIGIEEPNSGWNHIMAHIRYATVQAAVEGGNMMPKDFPFTAGIRVLCEGGVIEYQFRAGGASFDTGQPMSYAQWHTPGNPFQALPTKEGDPFQEEINYFIRCVHEGVPPSIVTPQDARLAIETALAVRESLETGKVVDLV